MKESSALHRIAVAVLTAGAAVALISSTISFCNSEIAGALAFLAIALLFGITLFSIAWLREFQPPELDRRPRPDSDVPPTVKGPWRTGG